MALTTHNIYCGRNAGDDLPRGKGADRSGTGHPSPNPALPRNRRLGQSMRLFRFTCAADGSVEYAAEAEGRRYRAVRPRRGSADQEALAWPGVRQGRAPGGSVTFWEDSSGCNSRMMDMLNR